MSDPPSTRRVGLAARVRRALKAAVYSGPRRDRWQRPDRVLDALALREGMRVADVGCGSGYFTFRLARVVGPEGRVYAVDNDADMRSLVADRAAEHDLPNVVTVEAEAGEPRLPEPVELALVVDTFHHLPTPPSYLQTLAAELAPGGRVAVIEPLPRWWLFGHATDPAAVRAALEEADYRIVAEYDFLPRQSFLIGRAALHRDAAGGDVLWTSCRPPRSTRSRSSASWQTGVTPTR